MSSLCFGLSFLVATASVAYYGEQGRYGYALSMLLLGILCARLLVDSLGIKSEPKGTK